MKLKGELVVIPCVSFGARARLATESGQLTPIELVALRGIAAGLDDVPSLSQVVGLGMRPVLDLIYDFWLKGYIVIDTAEARFRLTGEAETASRSDTLTTLATAENNIEIVPLMQELVSGAVLPHIGRAHFTFSESALAPTTRTGLSLDDVTKGIILEAIRQEAHRRSRKLGRQLAVQEAWIEPDQLLTEAVSGSSFIPKRMFLPLLADVEIDPHSRRLHFHIVEAQSVPPTVQKGIERKLSLLSEHLPEHVFFKRLRQQIERNASDAVSAEQESMLERLRRTTRELQDTDPGLVKARHEQLLEHYRYAASEIQSAANASAKVRHVVGYEAHDIEVRRMIERAQRQLILGNPWIHADALLNPPPGQTECLFDMLEAALSRGVQVFILWGIRHDYRLDDTVRNALSDLASRHRERLFVSKRPAELHAKIVVRDANEVLVTSYNFLSPPERRNSLELGLVVQGKTPEVSTSAVLEMLEWARDRYPDYTVGLRMLQLPQELGAEEPVSPALPHVPEDPDAVVAQREGVAVAPAIRHWAEEWTAVVKELEALATEHAGGVYLVIDRGHREELWRAVRSSTRRLAVLSDKLSVDVVTDQFVRLLCGRLERGTRCSFVYRREGATDVAEGPATRLREQAERFPDLCRLVEAHSHAKVLISDDELIVGSFNFLSYGGEYAGSGTRRERAELGLRVRSAETADGVLKALSAEWPSAFEALCGSGRTDVGAQAAARAPQSLQPLFRSIVRASAPGDALLEWFSQSASPWRDLEALQRASVSTELFVTAMAAAVAATPNIEGPEGRTWRARLAAARWSIGDFIGATLLLPKAESYEGMAPWVTELGASVEAKSPSYAPKLPAATAMTPDELAAAAILLLVALLEQGRVDYLDLLAGLELSADEALRSWIDAARHYYESVYQPLPMELLRRSAGNKRQREAEEVARHEFAQALASAENIGFKFPIGKHTWDLLKMPDSLLGKARLAVDKDAPEALSEYLAGPKGEGLDVEGAMDAASRQVPDKHNTRIEEPKRSICLGRLNQMIDKAQAWIDLAKGTTPSAADANLLTACWNLQAALQGLRADQGVARGSMAVPVLRFAAKRLRPLFESERS